MGRKRQPRFIKKEKIIFCEGDTERLYFNMLKRKYNGSTVSVKVINKHGQKGTKLISEAVNWILDHKKKIDGEVYVCFDDDSQKQDELLSSLKLAREHQIQIIYSKVCFEVWLLLHFQPATSLMPWLEKQWLFDSLSKELAVDHYEKLKATDLTAHYEDRIITADTNCQLLTKDQDLSSKVILDQVPYTNLNLAITKIFEIDSF